MRLNDLTEALAAVRNIAEGFVQLKRIHQRRQALITGPQPPAPFPIVLEKREGYVLVRPANAARDPIDATWPRP